jgi:hypothetical protein
MEEFWKKYDKYIISDEWKALRKQAIHAQGRICQLTGIKLLRKETHVHHWIYRDNFSDSQLCDLSVLSELSHYVIHDWIKNGHLDRESPDRVEKARELYHAWRKKKYVKSKSSKLFQRFHRWLFTKGVLSKKPKKKRDPFANKGRGGFRAPRTKWSTVTEKERHCIAIDRYYEPNITITGLK